MRTIGVVTVARSDYGIYLPILRQIQTESELALHLIVSGMHLSPEFGLTVEMIETDGFKIGDRVEMLLSSDTPEGISKSIGLGIIGFAQVYARFCPDILLVLGDRFEMLAAVVASMPFNIPIAHVHGGEATEGSIDEAIRHSITKMSHLHFVSTLPYRRRVIQLGEEPWRVIVSGAPSLDNLTRMPLFSLVELEERLGVPLAQPPILVTFHPVTLEYEETGQHITEILAALEAIDLPLIFTSPNADAYGRVIMAAIDQFVQTHPNAHAVPNLGTQAYFSLMKWATAMVGNSSSGIIEAASFELPVVNVGNRQQGRVHSDNVIDVACQKNLIKEALHQVVSPAFRTKLKGIQNPYGDGQAAKQIIQKLNTIPLDRRLIVKKFYNLGFDEV